MKSSWWEIGIVLVFLVVGCLCGSAVAMTGTGTASDPYIVWNDTDLKALGTNIGTYANAYIELGADIVCSGDQTPIGNETTPFVGYFDGKNHTITNLNVSGAGKQGLFGQCGSSFSIKNLKLINGYVSATSPYSGMLIGQVNAGNGVLVENIETDGCRVESTGSYVGGIVGAGAISCIGSVTYRNCYVHDGYVKGSGDYVGGIVGGGAYNNPNQEIIYDNCRTMSEYVRMTNSSKSSVGGIVGLGCLSSSSPEYINCEVYDCIIIGGYDVGGIAGTSRDSTGSIDFDDCGVYNTMIRSARTTGDIYTGGVVGHSRYTVRITNPVVDGCTITTGNVGGVVGIVDGGSTTIVNPTVRNSSITGAGSKVGGVVGYSK